MKSTVKFVSNALDATNESLIKRHAEEITLNPEAAVVVPFSELGVFNQVESNLSITDLYGNLVPVTADTVSTLPSSGRIEQEATTPVGERVAKELDTFDFDTPSDETLAISARAYFEGK